MYASTQRGGDVRYANLLLNAPPVGTEQPDGTSPPTGVTLRSARPAAAPAAQENQTVDSPSKPQMMDLVANSPTKPGAAVQQQQQQLRSKIPGLADRTNRAEA